MAPGRVGGRVLPPAEGTCRQSVKSRPDPATPPHQQASTHLQGGSRGLF